MWPCVCIRAALRRPLHDRRGVTAVEFAFVAMIFLMLLLGIVEYARYQFTAQSLRDINAEAARVALIEANRALALNPLQPPACPANSTLKNAVTTPVNLAPFLQPASLTITCATGGGGATMTIEASYPFQFVAPVLLRLTLPDGSITLRDSLVFAPT